MGRLTQCRERLAGNGHRPKPGRKSPLDDVRPPRADGRPLPTVSECSSGNRWSTLNNKSSLATFQYGFRQIQIRPGGIVSALTLSLPLGLLGPGLRLFSAAAVATTGLAEAGEVDIYRVNRRGIDFPRVEDLTSPEAACAALNRLPLAWGRRFQSVGFCQIYKGHTCRS
jgi:hypothetical protein